MSHFYIGLLSGTSVDGIDAVLVDFSSSQDKNNEKDQSRKRESIRVLASHCLSLPQSLSKKIHTLCQDKTLSPASLGKHPLLDETHQTFGNYCAQAALEVLALAGVEANQVQAIGSHGQTVHHQPPTANQLGFSLQIGCANTIAKSTGIKTVSDFRSADMQAGGHGAPLAPAFHQAIAVQDNDCYVFLNLGGIANITFNGCLGSTEKKLVLR